MSDFVPLAALAAGISAMMNMAISALDNDYY